MKRTMQRRAAHRQRKLANIRDEVTRYKDGCGAERASMARKLAAKRAS